MDPAQSHNSFLDQRFLKVVLFGKNDLQINTFLLGKNQWTLSARSEQTTIVVQVKMLQNCVSVMKLVRFWQGCSIFVHFWHLPAFDKKIWNKNTTWKLLCLSLLAQSQTLRYNFYNFSLDEEHWYIAELSSVFTFLWWQSGFSHSRSTMLPPPNPPPKKLFKAIEGACPRRTL